MILFVNASISFYCLHKPHPFVHNLQPFPHCEMLAQNLSAGLVFTVAFLTYYNSLFGEFVFDDHRAILTNDDLDVGKTSFWRLFVDDFWGGHMSRTESHKSYRPLTVLTFRYLNFWFAGLEPFTYHLVNVLLHCVASVLFLLISRRVLGGRERWPLYAAILFAVHSVHTEAVRSGNPFRHPI